MVELEQALLRAMDEARAGQMPDAAAPADLTPPPDTGPAKGLLLSDPLTAAAATNRAG